MNTYEKLLQSASEENVHVYESFDLNGDKEPSNRIDGLYIDGNIALDCKLTTTAEKSCVLAEELGHHYTTSGDIIDQSKVDNRKQEYRARLYGYNLKIGLLGFVKSYEAGCHTLYEMAEYLDVTEEYLSEAIKCYKAKYGMCATLDNYIVYFSPTLAVAKITNSK